MAADRYLLEAAEQPTLRLYQWEGPWLSLGYAQRWQPPEHLPWVRRPSGGRAVLHHLEFTYAFALPQVEGPLNQVYAQLTSIWVKGLGRWGAELGLEPRPASSKASCYQLLQRGEVCLRGKKWIGSAQVRQGKRLLQHGSIPYAVDEALFESVFPDSQPPAWAPVSLDRLLQDFPEPLDEQPWTSQEREKIRCLLA